jgi:hypothetical protein
MTINTRNSQINHAEFVVKSLQTEGKLPFSDVLSEEAVEKHTRNILYRERFFSPVITIFTFLSQVISPDQSCQGALAQVIAFFVSKKIAAPSANTAAYCKARTRLPEETISGLARECGQQLEAGADAEILWRKRHVKLVDGSTVSMPDTPKNQAAYQQADTQKAGIGFPIARVVALISLAAGCVLDFAIGPYAGKGTGEHALLRQLLHNFNSGDVVLGDNYYASFFFDSWAHAHRRGCSLSYSPCQKL